MTLREIEKIIDEADFCMERTDNSKKIISLSTDIQKGMVKQEIEYKISKGFTYIFFEIDINGDVEKQVWADHIDKEKIIVKKKLDEMTDEEIKQLRDKLCVINNACDGCPLTTNRAYGCAADFSYWKNNYFKFKDKEFEVEVEE